MTTQDIAVSGMTCAACSARVQRALEKSTGVDSANVNLLTSTATVSYHPDQVAVEQLLEAIRRTGYGAELPVQLNFDHHKSWSPDPM